MKLTKILIAHQSSIPHYRVDFFNKLYDKTKEKFIFDVVYDSISQKQYFLETLNVSDFKFNLLNTKTYSISLFNKIISIQNFIFSLKNYDVVIVEDAINNLSYPICHLLKPFYNYKIIKWGHGRDLSSSKPNCFKKKIENFKLKLIQKSDGYLAYTNYVKTYLVSKGIDENIITVINNTININKNYKLVDRKKVDIYKKELNISNKNILLYVGRIDERKKIPLLIDSLVELKKYLKDFIIFIVGDGDNNLITRIQNSIGSNYFRHVGAITDENILVKYYSICDLFVFPGDVGLGPLTAISYNAVPLIIDSHTHNPEIEYLNSNNSIILPINTDSKNYAESILKYLSNKEKINSKKNKSWDTIKHLTLDNMVINFITSIERLIYEKN